MTEKHTDNDKPRHIMDRAKMMNAIGAMRPTYTKAGGSARLAIGEKDLEFMLVQIKQRAALKKLDVTVMGQPGDYTVTLAPRPRAPVGRVASSARQAIEAIKPGLFASFPLDGPGAVGAANVKMMAQAAQRKLGTKYTVAVLQGEGVTTVTRIDSLDKAPTAARADIEAKLMPRYPFATMAIGDTHTTPLTAGVENIRTMAAYQKSKHGKRFSVNKRGDVIVIKRIE